MPITASVGALSYTKSADTNEFQYWYLETNQNATFNNFLDGGRMVIVGQDPTNSEALFVSIDGFVSRPQIKYQYHQHRDDVAPTTGVYRGVFYQSPNAYAYGSFATSGAYNNRAVLFPTNDVTSIPATSIKNYYPYLTSTANVTTICSVAPKTTNVDMWILYRDYNRLIYRIADFADFNTAGPLTLVNTTTPSGDYVPQKISKYSNGDAVVTLNLGNLGDSNNLIRRVDQNFVSATYDRYPTIWQKSYNYGTIYDHVLYSNDLYFVSSDNTNGDIAALDSSGATLWSKRIAGVILTGIHYYSNYLYVSGYVNSNGNLYIAKYDLSGNRQWQTELSGDIFGISKINVSNGVYVVGNVDTYGFALKVPIDGSIPVGTFTIKQKTYTYGTSSLTDASGGIFSTPGTSDTSLALFGNNTFLVTSDTSNYKIDTADLEN